MVVKKIIFLLFLLLGIFRVEAQNFDIALLKSVNIGRNKNLDPVFEGASNSVYPVIFFTPAVLMVHGVIAKDSISFWSGVQIGASIASAVAVSYGLKYAVDRNRPYVTYPELQNPISEHSASFPSGHTSAAFSVATSVSLCYPKWYVVAPAYLWAGSVGYSRMHLGVHYPSDVFVGALVGSGCAYLAYRANKWYHKRY